MTVSECLPRDHRAARAGVVRRLPRVSGNARAEFERGRPCHAGAGDLITKALASDLEALRRTQTALLVNRAKLPEEPKNHGRIIEF